jgi:uncharacterized membrane protein (UPF0127 family)/predicted small secreted protein
MKRRAVVAVVALVATAALLSGCGSDVSSTKQSQQQSVVTAEASLRAQGFTKVTLRIRHADGTVEEHCVWLADSELERQQGLSERTDPLIAGGEAMVFSFDADSDRTFWMKDTVLPLSIAWIDGEGAVIGTADMDPCPATSTNCEKFSAERPYRLAIEMAQGRLQDWGIRPGATVSLGASC